MSGIFLSSNTRRVEDACEEEAYRIPLAPKAALILNINAAIWAGAATAIVSVMRPESNIERIVALSNLILCLLVGAAVALLSCGCDRAARQLYKHEASKARAWLGVAEICDVSAICIVLASYGIFVWSAWSIVTLAAQSFH